MRNWDQIHVRSAYLALEKLETGTSTCADMAELVLAVVLGDDGSGVTTAYDDGCTIGSSLNGSVEEGLRTLGKLGELEDARRTKIRCE